MISQPVSSIFLCSPLPSGTWRTPGLSIPWYCLPTSSSLCLVFFPLSLCLQEGFGQTWWTGDMTIPLQYVSLYDGQEVFVWSDCPLDLGTDFLVGNKQEGIWQGSASVVSWNWEKYDTSRSQEILARLVRSNKNSDKKMTLKNLTLFGIRSCSIHTTKVA